MLVRRSFAALLCALSLVLVLAGACATQQSGSTSAASEASPAERGKYLVTIAGCIDCHTPGTLYGAPDTTRMLSGSDVPWGGPWGVVYASNLTPDPQTGLGQWTDEQILLALRTGARPDGRQLAPIMPWFNFSHLTDDDARAILAYLRSLPPVVHQEPPPVPPTEPFQGPTFSPPPPPAWDAANLPPPGDAPGH